MNLRHRSAGARQLVAGAGAVLGVVLLVLAAQLATSSPGDGAVTHDGDVPPAAAPPPPRPPAAAPQPAPADPAPAPASPPAHLTVLGRDVPLEPVGLLPDGSMDLPPTPHAGGWWAPGRAPADRSGTVVIAGHVDTAEDGPGIFAELAGLHEGALITLTTVDGRSPIYVVTAVASYADEALPADLFSRHGPRRLALITCTGPFDADARSYTRNLVVLAEPR